MKQSQPLLSLLAASLALTSLAGPAGAVVSAGGMNGNDKPRPGVNGLSAPAPAPARPAAAAAHAAPSAPVVWQKVDQTERVKREGLYDYATNSWVARNFKGLSAPALRFIEPNVPGGPKIPAEAIADPDKFTFDAIQRKNQDELKNLDYYKGKLIKPILETFVFPGAGKDEVPGMPDEMLWALETHLQPGDVILQSNDPGDGKDKFRDKFLHGMLYIGRGMVVHAIGVPRETDYGTLKPSVFLSRFDDALQRDVDGADRLVVIRPRHTTQADFNKIVEFAIGEVGKPYDFSLNSADTVRYYCTELPLHAYKLMAQPIVLPPDASMPLKPVTGNSYLAAMEKGDYDLVLVLNPKLKADTIKK
jgi:hypothetical protein